jgi:hypothetical protein
MPFIDTASAAFVFGVTQGVHVAIGFGAVLLFAFIAVVVSPWHKHQARWWLYGGAMGMEVFAIVKETVIDPWLEQDPFLWDGATDLLFWTIGIIMGFVVGWWLYRDVMLEYRPRRTAR